MVSPSMMPPSVSPYPVNRTVSASQTTQPVILQPVVLESAAQPPLKPPTMSGQKQPITIKDGALIGAAGGTLLGTALGLISFGPFGFFAAPLMSLFTFAPIGALLGAGAVSLSNVNRR